MTILWHPFSPASISLRFLSTPHSPVFSTPLGLAFLLNTFATARIECNTKIIDPFYPILNSCADVFLFLQRSPWPGFMNTSRGAPQLLMLFSFKNSTFRETGTFFVSVRLLNIINLFWKILNLFKIRIFKRIGINKQKHFGELPSAFLLKMCRSTTYGMLWLKQNIYSARVNKSKLLFRTVLTLPSSGNVRFDLFSSLVYLRLSVVCRYYCKHVRHSSANQNAPCSTPPCVQGRVYF